MKKHFLILTVFIFLFFLTAGKKIVLHPASYWEKVKDTTVRCLLCPRQCVLKDNQTGICTARINRGGELFTYTYARPVAVHVDPIEKKPLFHVVPGTPTLSIATAGCNMRCLFCQNWQISQGNPAKLGSYDMSPADVVKRAREKKCRFIVYTYTEPTVFYEYMIDICRIAKKNGLKNAMHSCGYINPEPLAELLEYMDAVNIDLKGFSRDFYRKMGLLAEIEPVLQTLKMIKDAGVWLEITNLIIPGANDDPEQIKEMCDWIASDLGTDVPVHFSRFHPDYKLRNLPPTPRKTLEMAYDIAKKAGLKYVYIGNMPGHPAENTYCPGCGKLLVRRMGYVVNQNNIVNGKCRFCSCPVEGLWELEPGKKSKTAPLK